MARGSAVKSAGLLVVRGRGGAAECLLVHPGGPYWRGRDEAAWSIPKGLVGDGEDDLAAAIREFEEETGLDVGGRDLAGGFVRLADRRQRGGKLVVCWMVEADLALERFHSNTFDLEWPPRSGRVVAAPECDRAEYFPVERALTKIHAGQRGFIEEAAERLRRGEA